MKRELSKSQHSPFATTATIRTSVICVFLVFLLISCRPDPTPTPQISTPTPSPTPIPIVEAPLSPTPETTVLRGKVMDNLGQILSGVQITVADVTLIVSTQSSSAAGTFSLGVSRLGTLTVNYELDGYLPIQRQLEARHGEYVWLPDVVMTQLDSLSNPVNLSSTTSTMQVAQGSEVSDETGDRQATLLIPAGTTAQFEMSNGSMQSVGNLDIRITEYTVGPNGIDAMPGLLPPTSGYTYAIDYNATQAIQVGAKNIVFNQPLYHYVENFLNFPVGIAVPAGYYDRELAAWIPSTDGRVIKILSLNNGVAQIDIDGDDTADDGSDIGVTAEELQQLGQLYAAGQSLWRVPITHFTPWDYNWPYGPPDDALSPNLTAPNFDAPLDDPDAKCGSVIECQNQILGESMPVTGTPFTLHYSSDRVPGYTAAYTMELTLTGDVVSPSLEAVAVQIFIAGERFEDRINRPEGQPFPPNQGYRFTWDRLDAYDRVLSGPHPVIVRIGYVYLADYKTPAEFAGNTFVVPSFPQASTSGVRITENRSAGEITLWQEFRNRVGDQLGTWDARNVGLGGWTFNIHHYFDPRSRMLYQGDGSRRSAESLNFDIITTIAGIGTDCDGSELSDCGNGLPANQAALSSPTDMVFGPDGSLYIAEYGYIRRITPDGIISNFAGNGDLCEPRNPCGDGGLASLARIKADRISVDSSGNIFLLDSGNLQEGRPGRIRKINADGIITTIAGNNTCQPAPCGDGGPAIDAGFLRVNDFTIAPDGTIYIADQHQVRQILPNGVVVTIAGNSSSGFSGDNGPAAQAQFNFITGLALGSEGNLYILDSRNNRIRRITPDGNINTFAGNGTQCNPSTPCGNGGQALQAVLYNPRRITVGLDGNVYFSEQTDNPEFNRIRRIGTDGIISAFAGTGTVCGQPTSLCGDGGAARLAQFNRISDMMVAPDGSLYIALTQNDRVRRVGSALPGGRPGDVTFVSEDGSEVYVFNSAGQHQRTLHALTNDTLYEFAYDPAGRLLAITDGDGITTTINRDTAGNPTSISGHYGQVTMLTLNSDGYISRLTNPLGEAFEMTYAGSGNIGLLTAFTNPNGNTTTFAYSPDGLLERHENAAGGVMTLTRTDTDTGRIIELSTSLDRTTTYNVSTNTEDNQTRTNTLPSGIQMTFKRDADSTRSSTAPDQTRFETVIGADPRWGVLAPVNSTATITLPSGLAMILGQSRTVDLADVTSPFSLESWGESLSINGRTYTSAFDRSTNTFTDTSPEGRQNLQVIDEQGRLLSDTFGNLLPVQMTYDADGRIETITQGQGSDVRTLQLAYNAAGYVETITDPLGQVTQYEYNAAGRIISETLPGNRVTTYAYDANGNLTSLTPPGRPAHTFQYDSVDLMTTYTPPDVVSGTDATTYSYNLDQQITRVTRPDGQMINFSYDTAGRLNGLTIGRGSYAIAYNATTGQISTITAPDGIGLNYTYDGFLVTGETLSGPVTGTISRVYDNNFRATSISVNGATPVAMSYDDDNLLTQVGDMILNRDPQTGLLTGTELGNVTDSISYNGFGEPVNYTASFSSNPLFDVDYTRDSLGRITILTETIGGVTTTYEYRYDTSERLDQVKTNGVVTAEYTYDANGNRLNVTTPTSTTSATYDNQDRLLTYGDSSYTYNANGDLVTKNTDGQTTGYNYDELGNLIAVTMPGCMVEYLVDGEGRRVGRTATGSACVDPSTKGYLYNGDLRIIAELDENNNIVSRFVYADGINVPEYMIRDGVAYRLVTDHLGSVRLVINIASGQIIQQVDYDDWGIIIHNTNPGFVPFGFAGGLYDTDTKLIRFGARDYDAEIGRWTNKDPIGFSGGDTNLYVYVLNDPLGLTDTTGQAWYDYFDWVKPLSDFSAGFGDTITFGGTKSVRQQLGINGVVNPCSLAYRGGKFAGYTWFASTASASAAGLTAGRTGVPYFLQAPKWLDKLRNPIIRNILRWERHAFGGKTNIWHAHAWPRMTAHLPNEFGKWWKGLKSWWYQL